MLAEEINRFVADSRKEIEVQAVVAGELDVVRINPSKN